MLALDCLHDFNFIDKRDLEVGVAINYFAA